MHKTRNKWILAGVILLFILAGGIFAFLGRTPQNNEWETGNTAGNLNNKGLFCERNGIVYFSNAYDNDVLYSMNADETGYKKLNSVRVSSINADDHRLYYSQSAPASGTGLGFIRTANGMYGCDLNGKNTLCYTKDPVGILALCGNDLFYQHYQDGIGVPLIKTSLDKKETSEILPDMVSPSCVVNGSIYYAGNGGDHYLYALDTTTGISAVVWEHPMWNPIYQNGSVYFMDLENNYALHRYDLSTGEDIVLTTERIDFFNIYGTMIYYQTVDTTSPALKRMYIDGTGEETVMEGNFESVNITSQYAYFNEYGSSTPVYHQSTYGSVNPTVFQPAVKE